MWCDGGGCCDAWWLERGRFGEDIRCEKASENPGFTEGGSGLSGSDEESMLSTMGGSNGTGFDWI